MCFCRSDEQTMGKRKKKSRKSRVRTMKSWCQPIILDSIAFRSQFRCAMRMFLATRVSSMSRWGLENTRRLAEDLELSFRHFPQCSLLTIKTSKYHMQHCTRLNHFQINLISRNLKSSSTLINFFFSLPSPFSILFQLNRKNRNKTTDSWKAFNNSPSSTQRSWSVT